MNVGPRNPIDWPELARVAGIWTSSGTRREHFPEEEFQRYRAAYLGRLRAGARAAFVRSWGRQVRA